VDAQKREVDLISIPRDLYHKGLKINAFHRLYGIDQLARELSDITGLKIDKYVIIDMFALIEVINILGGIDVSLEKQLVDPTYRIKRDDGTWGTLYYPAGDYHLNGVQALRIARSRYTTSDFDRSKRQQLVMEAMADQLKSLALKDVDKIYQLIRAMAAYVKTNLSVTEMLYFYLKYKDYAINAGNVIDTTNVLYHTFTNVYLLGEEAKEEMETNEDFDRGKYILLPRNNDWNLIRWYVRNLIQ
jgi:LCP family protein required for cell wall assembly